MNQTPIVVVSGLPRSGTSLMMQMLDAGGFPVLTDAERPPDENNPRGYYEYAPVKRMPSGDTAWLADARGKAVKIVSALLPLLPTIYPYRIVFMQRDLEEVVQSQQAMRARLGSANGATDADKLLEDTARHVQAIEKWLSAQARLSVLFVGYADVLADAAGNARQVADFIEAPLDIAAMVRAVDPSLWRERGDG
jgi:hypothetical protein